MTYFNRLKEIADDACLDATTRRMSRDVQVANIRRNQHGVDVVVDMHEPCNNSDSNVVFTSMCFDPCQEGVESLTKALPHPCTNEHNVSSPRAQSHRADNSHPLWRAVVDKYHNETDSRSDPMTRVPFIGHATCSNSDLHKSAQLDALATMYQSWRHTHVFPIIGINRVYRKMIKRLLRAERTVMFGLWSCDFVMEICDGLSLHDYLLRACANRPELRISFLLHENTLNNYVDGFEEYKGHAQISVFTVPMFNAGVVTQFLYTHLHQWMGGSETRASINTAPTTTTPTTRSAQTVAASKNCFHQKWVLFDRSHMLFGGCDVRSSYRSNYPEETNERGFFWNDLTLYIHRSRDAPSANLPDTWIEFLQCNTQSHARASVRSGAIPLPFLNQFSMPWSEEAMYVHLIETSTNFVYIENQYLYSSRFSTNRIMLTLLTRLQRAIKENQRNFRIFWVTNFTMKDEASALHIWGLQSSVCSSVLAMYLHRLGPQEVIDRHFWIGYLEQAPTLAGSSTRVGDVPIYTHTKWMCVDNRSSIHSSSNICDRSLSPVQSDVELGLVIYDNPALVAPIQQAIWSAHGGGVNCPPMYQGGDTEREEASVTGWNYLHLFAHLRAAKLGNSKFANYCPLDKVLPSWYMVRGVANEIFNTVGHYI